MKSNQEENKMNKTYYVRCCLSLAAALVVSSAQAFNWSDYSAGADVLVSENATATDADMSTINSYSKLRFTSGTTITFDISGDVSLVCPVAATGTVVKCGAGTLTIAASSAESEETFKDVDFEVKAGMLKMPQDSSLSDFTVGKVTIDEGGTFMTRPRKAIIIDGGLWGAGIITNTATTGDSQLRVNNESATPCVFSGRILGNGIRWFSNGNAHLTGRSSNFSGDFAQTDGGESAEGRGTVGFVKIGNPGEESSIGSGSGLVSREHAARMLYLGTGETTSKNYSYYDRYSTGIHYWDAGAHGGVTFTGEWKNGLGYFERLVLTGSNTVPCVIQGEWTGDSGTNATYVTKRGSGTWRFADNSRRDLSGVIAVEDGTLEFETIAEANENCSLGRAMCLQLPYSAKKRNASKDVDYAYLLGTTSSTGTMAYVGSADGICRSRPFAVTGRGRLSNAGTGRLSLADAFAATADGGTFVLDAPAGGTNSFALVRDGAAGGALSVEKTGAGVWALDGTNTFSGSLAVKEGTILVRNLPCTWFRFTVMETAYGRYKRLGGAAPTSSNDANTEIQELALYDANGVRRNVNMAFDDTYADVTSLPAGHACWTRAGTIISATGRDGDKMFDDIGTGNGCCIYYKDGNDKNMAVRLDTPSSWIPVVMHLDPQVAPITAFDVLTKSGTANGRTPIAYKFEVSHDGWDWRTVYTETNTPAASAQCWLSDPNESFTAGAVRPGKGFATGERTFATGEILPNVSAVSVASGATLEAQGDIELKTLCVDASGTGNGTVRGFAFVETGTLHVTEYDMSSSALKIPMLFENCTGLDNLSNWSLVVNGAVCRTYRVRAMSDGVVILPPGLMIFIR